MKILLTALGWFFCGMFGLFCLALLGSSKIDALIFGIWSVLSCPWVNGVLRQHGMRIPLGARVAVFVVGLFLAVLFHDSPMKYETVAAAPSVSPVPVVQAVAPSPTPVTPNPVKSTPSPVAAGVGAAPEPKSWKDRLPQESPELRQKYQKDSYLETWLALENVWLGYAELEDLKSRGFFINAQWKFNGLGAAPKGEQYGSCTVLGVDSPPPVVCGVGMFDSPDWGVQEEGAVTRFKAMLRDEILIRQAVEQSNNRSR